VLFSDVPIEFADWSPTGDQIGVLTSGQDGESLMVMNADGNSRLSLGTGVAMNWSWNPDGQTVVAQTRLSPQSLRADVKIHATDNGEELSSVASREDSTLSGVHYSPDGNFMVTARRKEGGEALDAELYIVDRDGKVVRKLTSVSGLVTYAWSPAGAMLAYVERESAGSLGGTLRVLDVNTGEAKTLTSQPVTGIFWSPDAKTVAAFGPLQRGLVDPSGNILNLTSEQSQVVMLAQTINVTTGEARPLFYIEPTARFLSVLVQFDRYSRAMTIWAPNSKRLLVPIRYGDGTQSGDLVIESESSGSIFPRLVAPGSMASWSPK
jgi:WD40 repeat protein